MTKVLKLLVPCFIVLAAGCLLDKEFPLDPESSHDAALWGVKRGDKWIVEPQYENNFEVTPGSRYAWVYRSGLWNLIDASGKELLPQPCEHYSEFEANVYITRNGRKYGLVSTHRPLRTTGAIYDTIFLTGSDADAGTFIVKRDGKFGLLSFGGEALTPAMYDTVRYDGWGNYRHLLVKQNGKYGIITLRGRTVIPCAYDSLRWTAQDCYRDQYAARRDGKWGLLNAGDEIVPLRYDSMAVNFFSCKKIVLFLNDSVACIGAKGKPAAFDREDWDPKTRWSGDVVLR